MISSDETIFIQRGARSYHITSKWLLANPQAKEVFSQLEAVLSEFDGNFTVSVSEESEITADSPIDPSITKIQILDHTSKCDLRGTFINGSFTIDEEVALIIRDESGTMVGRLPVDSSNWSLRDGINGMRQEITPTPLETGMPKKDNVEEPLIVDGYKRGPLS